MNQLITTQSNLPTTADPAAIAAAETAKTKLQAAYQMALYQPRNVEQARQNLLSACRRPKFAEKAEYSKPVGGSTIVGPSIRFAETAIREWGNILSDISVVFEDEHNRRIRVNMIDLQTNSQFTKELSVRKTVERRFAKDREVVGERENSKGEKVYIVKATDDEIANKEAAMISKAVRNEGLRLIPSDIIEEALDTARDTLHKQIKDDPGAAMRKVIDAFAGIGVKVASLEKFLGHDVSTCSPKEIQELRNVFGSIRDGEASWNDYLELKRKASSEDDEERKSAVDALSALGNKKTPAKKAAAKKAAKKAEAEESKEETKGETPKEPESSKEPEEKPKEQPKTKGALIAEVSDLLKQSGRDQVDLIRWAVDNKHIEEAETLQDFTADKLKMFVDNWKAIVL